MNREGSHRTCYPIATDTARRSRPASSCSRKRWHDRFVQPSVRRTGGGGPRTTPHTQLDQQPEVTHIRDELARRLFAFDGVEERPSAISMPGARALWLAGSVESGPPEAFLVGREFGHLHPHADQSLHAMLPPALVDEAMAAGWVELHPVARLGLIPETAVMIYAPRDEEELDVVERLVRASYEFARGSWPAP